MSITSNILGILTFVIALSAAAYARLTYIRSSDDEYLRVKTSLSWYKTESAWLTDLVAALDADVQKDMNAYTTDTEWDGKEWPETRRRGVDRRSLNTQRTEYQMFAFVMDDLLNLEKRLLDIVNDIENRTEVPSLNTNTGLTWTLIPRSWQGGKTSVAVTWLGVRTKALELVRQREALTARVQFLQMSMVSSRLRDLESHVHSRGAANEARAVALRSAVETQARGLKALEAKVHGQRVSANSTWEASSKTNSSND